MSGTRGRQSEPALRASLWMLGDRGVSLLLGAVMTWHLARYLGVTGYGHYSLALTLVAAFALITDLVSGQVVVREVAARPEEARRVVGTALLLRGVLAIVAVLACAAAAAAAYSAPVRAAILVYSATLLLAPCDAVGSLLQGRLRLRELSLVGIAATLLNLVLLLMAIRHKASLAVIAAVAAAPVAVRSLGTVAVFWRERRTVHRARRIPLQAPRSEATNPITTVFPLSPQVARRLLGASWPLAGALLLTQVPGTLPTLCLAQRPDGGVELGAFAAALRVPLMLGIVPNTVMIALFPLMARAWATSSAEATLVLHRAYAALLALALPIAISCVVLAEEGIQFLYGRQFTGAVAGLKLLALSILLMYPGIVAGNMLVAMGRERVNLVINIGAALLSALSAPPLCRAYGALGAAASVATIYALLGIASMTAVSLLRSRSRAPGLFSCPSGRGGEQGPRALSYEQQKKDCAPSFRAVGWYQRITGCGLVMLGTVVLLRRVDPLAALAGGAVAYALCLWLTGLMPIVLRFPTLESLAPEQDGGAPTVPDRPTLLYRLCRRAEAMLVTVFWHVIYFTYGARYRARRAASAVRIGPGGWDVSCCAPSRRTPHAVRRTQILVLDRDFVGDLICATPALAALRRRFPQATITLAVAPGVAPLFRAHPAVDRVVALEEGLGLRGAFRLFRQLRRLAPQSVVIGLGAVPANAWLGHLAGVLCRAPVRLGEAHGRYHDLLTDPVRRDLSPRHWSRLYLDVLAPLDIEGTAEPLGLVTAPEEREAVAQFLDAMGPLPRPWIGIHAGGRIYRIPDQATPGGLATLSRRWPAERYGLLVRRLLADGGTVFLTGSSEDAPATGRVIQVAREGEINGASDDGAPIHGQALPMDQASEQEPRARLIDTTGRLSLAETAALIERLDVFVSNDTGPMHLAFALDVPSVALFGPTDPRWVGPVEGGQRHRILVPGLPCSPCGGASLVPCRNPAGQECLTAIPVETVYAAVKGLLGSMTCAQRTSRRGEVARCSARESA